METRQTQTTVQAQEQAAGSDSITCPRCGNPIPIAETVRHQAEDRLRHEFEVAQREAENVHAAALAAKDTELSLKLEEARLEVEAVARVRAEEALGREVHDLSARLEAQSKRLAEAERRELSLLNDKRELHERQEALELEVARKLDAGRSELVAETTARVEEEYRLKLREKDLTLEQMSKRIDELQASASQKRSGLQGEVLEREIEDVLRELFPTDAISPVKSGKRGADVAQRVRSPRGLECGALLWESKNARNWSNAWVQKLKDDQRAERADMAIIVSSALPEGVQRITRQEGVWICGFASVPTLATALRIALIEIAQARSVDANMSQALDALYEYLCSKDFQHRLVTTAQAAVEMRTDLDAERRSLERLWAKREKQIDRITQNSAGMYGELQAIVGDALQPVPVLELPAGEDDDRGPLALAG